MATNGVNYSDDGTCLTFRPLNSVVVITDRGRLYLAVLKGDWKYWKSIENMPNIPRRISDQQETTLHIAAAASQEDFVENLLNGLNNEDLIAVNNRRNNVLVYAAASGNVKIAKVILMKNEILANPNSGITPLYMAALSGHSEMAKFLYSKTMVREWAETTQEELFLTCVKNDIYGVALRMMADKKDLARARGRQQETVLHVLASKPYAFIEQVNREC
ncbi:uncharacterized protein LOC112012675 isoform X2 [Quercus suber]|uniref:uncharacterized protein LOC112012675 isoform X2 n=2 Tax=Quercus suber TaxID=58331 RepID=UPI0032DE6D42